MQKSEQKIDFAIGGQAIIEGVMMRSPHYVTMAVRKENGEIIVRADPYVSLTKRSRFFGLPLVRGVVVLIESLVIGMRALTYSQDVMLYEDDRQKKNRSSLQVFFDAILFVITIGFSFGLAIFFFKFLPLWITQWLTSVWPLLETSKILYNVLDGVLKITFFVLYIAGIGLMPPIRRVFAYHGAEHKAIFAYEKHGAVTPAFTKKESPRHPRCGTSFIIQLFLISVLVYIVLPTHDAFFLKFLERIAVLPIIAGLSYELLKINARHQHRALFQWLATPGIWLQYITTKEPDDTQIEVAVAALNKALELEKL